MADTSIKLPDVAVVERSRWEALGEAEKEKFVPLCPDFVIEIKSDTDRLKDLQEQKIYMYTQTPQEPEIIEGFERKSLIVKDILPNLVVDLSILL